MFKKLPTTVLVTGATGMLGLKLCDILERKGFRVEKQRFDIISTFEVKKNCGKLKTQNIDYIIHCAAMTDVNKCELNKKLCYRTNVIGTRNIVYLARQLDANLIYVSTPMVFSGEEGNYKETDNTDPVNYYSKTKLLGEKETAVYNRCLIVRMNPIGLRPPGAHPSFIQWFVEVAQENRSFDLFSDVRINPISTDTFSRILISLIKDFKPGILHLGSHDIANKADIWRLIVKKFPKFSGQVMIISVDKTETARIAKRPKEMWLNIDKALKSGYKLPAWKNEVKRVLKDMRVIK